MNIKINKKAGLEDSNIVDSFSYNKSIRISTTARKKIREACQGLPGYEDLSSMNNLELNPYLAGVFKDSGRDENLLHYFLLRGTTKDSPTWIEIRYINNEALRVLGFNYFFSILRQDSIDIITLASEYIKPKKPRKIKIKR